MSEPDWLGPATDALKDVGLDDAADLLAKAPAQADLLERAIVNMEGIVRDQLNLVNTQNRMGVVSRDEAAIIAEHRGETPEATLARLSPPPIRPAVPWTEGLGTLVPTADIRALQQRLRGQGANLIVMDEMTRVTTKDGEELDLSRESDRERFDRMAMTRNPLDGRFEAP